MKFDTSPKRTSSNSAAKEITITENAVDTWY